jgi:hypothetical protein
MTDPGDRPDLPSSRTLLRSTLIAFAVAVTLLVTVILPAEYGVDPTGVGRVLGLTQMGRIKAELAKEAATIASFRPPTIGVTLDTTSGPAGIARDSVSAQSTRDTSSRPVPAASAATHGRSHPGDAQGATNSHITDVVLQPNEGKEIKLVMRKGARVTYSWATNGGVVNFDTHADAPGIKYHGYAKGSARKDDEGILVAAFDGAHGWFWRNRGKEPLTVTLRTSGDYQELKRN